MKKFQKILITILCLSLIFSNFVYKNKVSALNEVTKINISSLANPRTGVKIENSSPFIDDNGIGNTINYTSKGWKVDGNTVNVGDKFLAEKEYIEEIELTIDGTSEFDDAVSIATIDTSVKNITISKSSTDAKKATVVVTYNATKKLGVDQSYNKSGIFDEVYLGGYYYPNMLNRNYCFFNGTAFDEMTKYLAKTIKIKMQDGNFHTFDIEKWILSSSTPYDPNIKGADQAIAVYPLAKADSSYPCDMDEVNEYIEYFVINLYIFAKDNSYCIIKQNKKDLNLNQDNELVVEIDAPFNDIENIYFVKINDQSKDAVLKYFEAVSSGPINLELSLTQQEMEKVFNFQHETLNDFMSSTIKPLDKSKYNVTSGSTIVTFPKATLEELEEGAYILLNEHTSSYSETTFTISKPQKTKYTLTFDLDGGTLVDGQTGVVTFEYEEGSTIKLPKPNKNGLEFDYWEGSKHYAGEDYVVNGNHSFKAIWKQKYIVPNTVVR